jgi:hypothetical protein
MKFTSPLWTLATLTALTASSSLLGVEPGSAQAVKRELDPNGQLFSYVDVEDGWAKVAADIAVILKDTPMGTKDLVAISDASGLSQIRAFGLSSTSLKNGYDNRFFLHTPGGRKGLLAIFPGKPASFDGARYAPVDTDLFADVRLDVPAVVAAITQIAVAVSDNRDVATLALDMLKKDPTGFGGLLNFKGRVVAAVRLHSHEKIEKLKAGSSANIPMDIFLRAETGGAVALNALGKLDSWKREDRGNRIYFTSTTEGGDAVIIIEGETVTAGMPRAFVEECLVRKDGLAQNTTFTQALADTAQMGHAVFYATPRVYSELRGYTNLATLPGLLGTDFASAARDQFVRQLIAAIPAPTKPVISVIVARPDGLLVRERSVQSLKAAFPVMALLTPDFLGQILRMSAQAYAAKDAEERAGEITHQKISADLDRAGIAANRYFAAHAEEQTVKLSALREALPEEKLPDFKDTVETDIEFARQSDKVDFELKGGRSLTHVFKLTPDQRTKIESNLQKLAVASVEYLVAGHSSASSDSLVENGFMTKLEPVVGEDYSQITLELDTATLTVTTPGGQEISFNREPNLVMQTRHHLAELQIAIEHNLAKIDAVAQRFLVDNPNESEVGVEQLTSKELLPDIKSLAGEDYAQTLTSISKNQPKLEISSPRAGTVIWLRPLDAALQANLTKRLIKIEHAAVQYFAKNPQAEVVISGELVPAPEETKSEGAVESSEDTDQKLPDLTTLVIRRDYKNIKLTLENGHVIEVPRSKGKK